MTGRLTTAVRLAKLSSVDVTDLKELSRKARVGDVLVMSPKIPPGGEDTVSKVFNAISRRIQGDLTHSAIYAGGGKVIDFRLDHGIKKMPLAEAVKGLDVALVRPSVSAEDKLRAVNKIHKAMSNSDVHYSVPQLFKTLGTRVMPTLGSNSKRLSAEICSTLIAKAFDKKIVHGKPRDAVVPSDFLNSKKMTHLLTLRQKTSQEYETMSAKKWKQTAMDVPAAVISSGVGYGIGRTLAEMIGRDIPGTPTWVKALPAVTTGVGLLGSFAGMKVRDHLKQRRLEAEGA